MELALSVSALWRSDTDSTLLRARLLRAAGNNFSAGAEELFSRSLDIVWGDRHYIQLRNTTAKAIARYEIEEKLLRGLA